MRTISLRLDLMVLQQFEKVPDEEIKAYISADGLERIRLGGHELRPRSDGTLLINYVGPFHSYPHYSMTDVLHGAVPPDALRDKIVLVGATALGIGMPATRHSRAASRPTWESRYTRTSLTTCCTAASRTGLF